MSLLHLHTDKSTQTGTRPDKQHMHRTNSVDAKIIPFLNEWRYERSTSMPSAFVTHTYIHEHTCTGSGMLKQQVFSCNFTFALHILSATIFCRDRSSYVHLASLSPASASNTSLACSSAFSQSPSF